MLDALLSFGVAFMTLASLCLGEATTIAGVSVRRSSLMGYQVGDRVLELDIAAAVLSSSPELAPTMLSPAPDPPKDLLRGPVLSFGFVSETWRAGSACSRREGQLRRALGPGVHRSTTRSRWGEPAKVCLRYASSAKVPPIESKTPGNHDAEDRRIVKSTSIHSAPIRCTVKTPSFLVTERAS